MIDHQMTLDYALHPGWMAPFVEGVQAGRVVARKCGDCDAVSFPPLRVCPCGALTEAWVDLPGTAQITLRSQGADGDFALVRFAGADTLTTVALYNVASEATAGQLIAPPGGGMGLCLGPLETEE